LCKKLCTVCADMMGQHKSMAGWSWEKLNKATDRFPPSARSSFLCVTNSRWNHNQLALLGVSGLFLLANLAASTKEERDHRTTVKCHGGSSSPWQRQQFESYLKVSRERKASINLDRLPEYTSQDVAQRNGPENNGNGSRAVWMSYGGFVFDVTDFILLHPGGAERISRAAGAAIEPFWYLHQQHYETEEPLQIMRGLIVGRLAEKDQELVDAKLEKMQEECGSFRLEMDFSGIRGRVVKLSLDDLKALPKTDQKGNVGCPQNQDRRPLSTSTFGGVRMQEVLSLSKSKHDSHLQLAFYAMDGEKVTIAVDNYNDILVCYEMDGAPLTQGRGFPLRIMIPGKRVIKWVQRIEVSEAPSSNQRKWFWFWGR